MKGTLGYLFYPLILYQSLSSSAQIFHDGRNNSDATNPKEAVSNVEIFNRKIRLFVSDEDRMVFAEISDGDPTDEVWIDRSYDTSLSWDGRLGYSVIPFGMREVRTVMFNIDKRLATSGRLVRASLRACGKAGNRGNTVCTSWYRAVPKVDELHGIRFREAGTTEIFGRRIRLLISDEMKIAYAHISNGDQTDEVWINRNSDGGSRQEEKLGYTVIPQYLREVQTDIFHTENFQNKEKASVKACGKAGNREEIVCTIWAQSIPLSYPPRHRMTTTTTSPFVGQDVPTLQQQSEDPPQESPDNGINHTTTWVIVSSVVIVAVVILTAICWIHHRHIRIQRILSENETKIFFNGLAERARPITNAYAHENVDSYAYDKDGWEIRRANFVIDWDSVLGSGSSGMVLNGKVRDMKVAVKTIRANGDVGTQLRSLLSEIKVLQHIGQCENIVNMIGCNTSKLALGKVYLFLEFCPLGSLDKYLREHRTQFRPDFEHDTLINVENGKKQSEETLNTSHLLNWCLQITNAMRYLQMKKVIHADLASRNVLLASRDCAKLTDFGLSRRLNEYSSYVKKHQEPLPWRHMALEALKDLSFSHQSDVWSLGITFWEIFSFGEVPYPGYSWTPDFIKLLEENLRPMKPSHAPDGVYSIMLDCWKAEASSRPSFDDIHHRLWNNKNARELVMTK